MNPYEPPETIDVSPPKPVKRFSVVRTILMLTMVGVVMFGLEVLHLYNAGRLKRQRAIEQQIQQQQLKSNETDEK